MTTSPSAELEFLRFFYNKACEYFSDGGTDEAYWFKEAFEEETGKDLPEGY